MTFTNTDIPNQKLEKAVEHIIYEIIMFRFSANTLAQLSISADVPLKQEKINSFLEVFSIHARNLFYFFYTKRDNRKMDDIICLDYLEKVRPFLSGRTPERQLELIKKKTAKQIAHLTYSRLEYNKATKPWKYIEISNKLEKTISAFINALPADKREWFNGI